MLAKSQIVRIVEGAFLPLECKAELQDYEHAFGFRVFLPNGKSITREVRDASTLLHECQLSAVIESCREEIQSRGIALAAWERPMGE